MTNKIDPTRRKLAAAFVFTPLFLSGCNKPLKKQATAVSANANSRQAFSGYEEIFPAVDVRPVSGLNRTNKVDLLHFCGFTCQPCYRFESHVARWLIKNRDRVNYVRVAPALNPSWENPSRLFYALQQFDLLDKLYAPVAQMANIDATFVTDKRKAAQRIKYLAPEIDEEQFLKTMDSYAVNTSMWKAIDLGSRAGLTSIPNLVINGKYRVRPIPSRGVDRREVMKVVDTLVSRESI